MTLELVEREHPIAADEVDSQLARARLQQRVESMELRLLMSEKRRRALLHIMADINAANKRLADQRKAMLHILDDYEQDRRRLAKQTERLDNSRRALLHLLQDSHVSNRRLEQSRKAMIHMMGDLRTTTLEMEGRERDLREKQEQLVQAGKLATLGELTTGVAHELNNPLNNIGLLIGNVIDLIEFGRLDQERMLRDLRSATQQVGKATQIISHLRTFGRAAPVSREPVSLNETIGRALVLMLEQLRLRGIDLELDLSSDDPIVLGNAIQLEQVFLNLLTNARDAVADSPRKVISVTTRAQPPSGRLTVRDSGPGIAPGFEQRIFDPFFTTKEVGKGTGLGLSITYGIVRDHDGTIRLENEPGEGAEFLIDLPLATADAPAGEYAVTAPQVLIVDDDPALLEALSEALHLRMEEVDVRTSDSAQSAFEMLAATDVDVVVADIKMPKMDGLELLGRIRELRPDTPTLLITGHGEHELAVQALRGGAYDYVQKPIDREYFVSSLSRAIQLHRLSRDIKQQRAALEQHARELEGCVHERTIEMRELYHREQMARRELEETHRKLVEAQRQRDELVSMIAHDLAGPLTAVKGYAEVLEQPTTPASVRQRAQKVIHSQVGHMARLVSDLADAERLASGHFHVQSVACDLASISREQVETVAAGANEHTLRLESPSEVPILCDPDRVAQVLSNILSNAVKYTPGGEVRVRLWTEARTARLSISDDGPGIPADALETIFEPHQRLKANGHGAAASGAGLGLHIARGIVEAHGGHVWAESGPGSGTTFQLSLPLHGPVKARPAGKGRRARAQPRPPAARRRQTSR